MCEHPLLEAHCGREEIKTGDHVTRVLEDAHEAEDTEQPIVSHRVESTATFEAADEEQGQNEDRGRRQQGNDEEA